MHHSNDLLSTWRFGIICLLGSVSLSFSAFNWSAHHTPLDDILRNNRQLLKPVIKHPDRYRLQIIYTQIDRDENNHPKFKTFTYRQNETDYFYPASTVKMPTAFMALEKINHLNIPGLTRETPMFTEADRVPQTPVTEDTTAVNGLPSVGHYIRKIFAVSDNDAYNRLYEFVGQRALNQGLYDKGFHHLRITCRLEAPDYLPVDNQITNAIVFRDQDRVIYSQGQIQSQWIAPDLNLRDEQQGEGYLDRDGTMVEGPFDFSQKNYISLRTLHDVLKTVLFPESVPEKQRFHFTPEDYRFIYQAMSSYPREFRHPYYDAQDYPDHYVKFLGYGDGNHPIPDSVRIFNKVGDAYGYLTDVAYVVDFKHRIEYLVAVNLLVNGNGIFNDGNYDYETTGFPFLAHLGEAIYNFELTRPREYPPDLRRFEFNY